MQGYSVAKSLTDGIYNSYKGLYTDELYLVEDGSGFRVQENSTSARALALDAPSVSLRNAPIAEGNGIVVLYKKVTE